MKKQIALLLLLAVCAGIFAGCAAPEVETLKIDAQRVSIFIGEKYQLDYEVSPKDAADDLIWKSDNEAVATVDGSGRITGEDFGECKISVRSENFLSDNVTVYVIEDFTGIYQFQYGMVEGEYVDTSDMPDMTIKLHRDKTAEIYSGTELVHSFTWDCTGIGSYSFNIIGEEGAHLMYDTSNGTITYTSSEFHFVFG